MPNKNLEARKAYHKAYYEKHKEEWKANSKEYRKTHPRKRRKSLKNRFWCKIEDKPIWKKIFRKWYHFVHDCPDNRLNAATKTRTWRIDNPDKVQAAKDRVDKVASLQKLSDWKARNPGPRKRSEEIKARRRVKRKANYIQDYYGNLNNRLTVLLRGRLYRLVSKSNARKSASMLKLLGCSLDEFKKHLEGQFAEGMSWDNYGGKDNKTGWHLEHKIACYRFEMKRAIDQRVCFHYSNIAPLWATENVKKDSRKEHPKLTEIEVAEMHRAIYGDNVVSNDFTLTQPISQEVAISQAQLGA